MTTKTRPTIPAEGVQPSNRDPIADWLDVFMRLLDLKGSEANAVRDELEDHLRSRVDDLIITGSCESDAVRQAVAELGETAALAKRFKHAQHPNRRRTLMSTALVALAASAISLGAFSVLSPPASLTTAAGGAAPAGIVALQPVEGEVAPFNERLQRYDLAPLGLPTEVYDDGQMVIQEYALQRLRDTVQSLITPDSWIVMGGDSASFSTYGMTLFIEGDKEVHDGVQWILGGFQEEALERAAALEAQQDEREAAAAEFAAEQERRAQDAIERTQRERRGRVAELEAQYQDLTSRFADMTRGMKLAELEVRQLTEEYREHASVGRRPFIGKMNDLQQRLMAVTNTIGGRGPFQSPNKTDAELVQMSDSDREQYLEQVNEREQLQLRIEKLDEEIAGAIEVTRMQLAEQLANAEAMLAEIQLDYEDTEVRLQRVRSVLLDLELAEYTRSSSGLASAYPARYAEFVEGRSSNGPGQPNADDWRFYTSYPEVAGTQPTASPGAIQQAVLNLAKDHTELTEQMQITLLGQARQIAMLMITHADANDGAVPIKPSQLRELVEEARQGPELFLTSQARVELSGRSLGEDAAWQWLDQHASFELLPGTLYESDSVLVRTKVPMPGGQHIAAFGDGHAKVLASTVSR